MREVGADVGVGPETSRVSGGILARTARVAQRLDAPRCNGPLSISRAGLTNTTH